MSGFSQYPDDSGMIIGEAYQLEYSKRQGQWTLRHPHDKRRAWRDESLIGLVEKTLHTKMSYRYAVIGRDGYEIRLQSQLFEGVLLAIAGRPRQVVIPPEFEADYSEQEMGLLRRWQELLIAGTASSEKAPVDAQSLSFRDAMEIISELDGVSGDERPSD